MGIGDGDARFFTRVFGDLLPVSLLAAGRRVDPRDACLLRAPFLSFDMVLSDRVGGLGNFRGTPASVFLVF
jgi:hypothetical protein